MSKTTEKGRNRCPKCGEPMDTKRKDAKQCRKCRREQASYTGNKINEEKRKREKIDLIKVAQKEIDEEKRMNTNIRKTAVDRIKDSLKSLTYSDESSS